MPKLYTSLAEIRFFNPCAKGWKKIKEAKKDIDENQTFPLTDCCESNSFSDIVWWVS